MPIRWEDLLPDPEDLVTVEEAAEILGLSVATVRRKAADGEIAAMKVGRSWVIDASTLKRHSEAQARENRPPASKQVDVALALQHVAASDLRNDAWAPDVLNHEDQVAAERSLTQAVERRLDQNEHFEPAMIVAVPKTAIFQRNAIDLTLPDRVAFHASVLTVASTLEDKLSDAVFSARLNAEEKTRRLLEPGAEAWVRWNQAVLDSVPDKGWIAATDVTAYFDCIVHAIILRDLQRLGMSPELQNPLREMLALWTRTPGIGIPQGPDASRLLANLYFLPIDEIMLGLEGIEYFRYMDDIRIVSASRHHAINALQVLDDECRLRNLHLSTKKTKLIPEPDAQKSLQDSLLDRLSYEFDYSVKKVQVRKDLAALVAKTLKESEAVDLRRLRFGLLRLRKLREERGLRNALNNLEHLAPLGRQAVAYLLPWYGRVSVQRNIEDYLTDTERNTSDYFSAWLLAGFLDTGTDLPEGIATYARGICSSARSPEWHQAIAMNVIARGRRTSDIRLLKERAESSFSPLLVRGACVALARAGELDRQVARRALRFASVEPAIKFVSGRATLPLIVSPRYR